MFGSRIQRARKALGLSLRDLANIVGLSHAAIKKYEDNQTIPSSDMLLKLAKALHVRTEYFFRPERFTLDKIQYRKHDDMSPRHLEEITAKILDRIERQFELKNLLPSAKMKKFPKKAIRIKKLDEAEEAANQIREEWKLGLEPLPNLADIFEDRGIEVIPINNEQYRFDGLSATINDISIIVVGEKWPGDRQRFTLAHELAHHVLEVSSQSSLNKEKFFDRFSGAFLLPKMALINILGEHRNYIEPRELNLIKQEFGISMLGVLHRAKDTGIITASLYQKIRSEFKERGWHEREPGEQYPKEKMHVFEQMIFHALAEGYIGESKAAELMNIPVESFRSLRAMEIQNFTSY